VQEEERSDLIGHLAELRARLLRGLLYAAVGTTLAWIYYEWIYRLLSAPVIGPLKEIGGEMTFRSVLEPFMVRVAISLVCGLILASPLIYYEFWAFVAPGLTRSERRAARPLVPVSGVLFLMGVATGYWITGPSVAWLLHYKPPDTEALLTLNDTLLLLLKLYIAFGLAFQLPIVLVLLATIGIVNSRLLISRWREAVVGAFLVAAIITPTWDPIIMTVAALPMAFLYLGTIGAVKVIEGRRARAEHKEHSLAG